MRFARTGILAFVGLTIMLVASGCATKPPSPDPLVQCQLNKNVCEQRREQCQRTSDNLSNQFADETRKRKVAERTLVDKENEAKDIRQSLADCRAKSARIDQRVNSLEAAKTALENRLTKSILQKDVQIELLNNKLSVRVLNRILFESGSAAIQRQGLKVLGEVAGVLVNGNELIRVEGHTDNVPISTALKYRYPTNWDLSAARAISVVRFFQDEHEIRPVRLEAVGHSYYQPVTSNDTEVERQFNRRVEIVLTAPQR